MIVWPCCFSTFQSGCLLIKSGCLVVYFTGTCVLYDDIQLICFFPLSLAVSIKMNVLLFSPGLLVLFLRFLGWQGTLVQLVVCALVQVVLGAPFLFNYPAAYLSGAFNFGRVFLYQWTVNWRILPEWIFLHKGFHIFLLLMHLLVVVAFALKHWAR